MKVKFWLDNCANIHSLKSKVVDIEKEYGISDEEWDEMEYEDKYEIVEQWAQEHIEIYWREVE